MLRYHLHEGRKISFPEIPQRFSGVQVCDCTRSHQISRGNQYPDSCLGSPLSKKELALPLSLPCPHDKKEIVMKTLADQTKDDSSVIKVDETDGVKLYVKDGWVLMRPSGTEPIFRVYSESKDKNRAEELAMTYKKLTEDIIKKQ